MTIPAIATLCTVLLTVAAATSPPSAAPPAAAPSGSILDHAKSLPDLPIKNGEVKIPLSGSAPFTWRPIRDGITITPSADASTMKVAYTRTRAKAAGAALVIKPGTLTGLDSISLTITGNRSHTLYLNLTQSDGSVWTLGPIMARPGEPREVILSAADIELDPFQNRARPAAPFDASSIYMLTFLDISGHMSQSEPECDWTIASLKAVRP